MLFLPLAWNAEAQVLNRVRDRIKQTAEDRALDEAGEATDRAIDDALDGTKDQKEKTDNNGSATENAPAPDNSHSNTSAPGIQSYANYDFVPGDEIIFQYDMAGEADAEIPGRLLIDAGTAEIQTYNGEKVLFVPISGNVYMKPYMNEEAYLPEQFTIEFDMLANGNGSDCSELILYFRKKEDAGGGSAVAPIRISLSCISGEEGQPSFGFDMEKTNGRIVGNGSQYFPPAAHNPAQNNWRKVAIYVNRNIGKLYIDQHRIGIVNQIDPAIANMVELEVRNDIHPVMIKNFRIAGGGSDAYNKIITSGKFIAYGILFEVNKATLKPESMGTLNEIAKMMKQNGDLRFEIGGHTDSDGTATLNNKLSQERAEAVKQQLVSMGIDASRLSTKGYGSSRPVADNNSPENKARNRRVEFVKL